MTDITNESYFYNDEKSKTGEDLLKQCREESLTTSCLSELINDELERAYIKGKRTATSEMIKTVENCFKKIDNY